MFVSYQLVHSTGRCNDNVRVGLLVLEKFGILGNRSSTIEDGSLHLRHIFAESSVLVLNLVRKFTGVAHNKDGGLAIDWLDLLERGEDEYGGLTKTGFGLAKNIGTENSLRNSQLLDCRVNRADVR